MWQTTGAFGLRPSAKLPAGCLCFHSPNLGAVPNRLPHTTLPSGWIVASTGPSSQAAHSVQRPMLAIGDAANLCRLSGCHAFSAYLVGVHEGAPPVNLAFTITGRLPLCIGREAPAGSAAALTSQPRSIANLQSPTHRLAGDSALLIVSAMPLTRIAD